MADDTTVTFDFTSADEVTALGFAVPETSSGTNIESAIEKDGVTITFDYANAGTPTRFYTASNGKLDLRMYTNSSMTVAVPEGKVIKQMSWTTQNSVAFTPDAGEVTAVAWTGEANTVTFAVNATSRINVLTVVYGVHEEEQQYTGNSVTLDLNDEAVWTAWGVAIPEKGQGTSVNGLKLASGQVSITCTDPETASTPSRIFKANNDAAKVNLRVYTGAMVEFAVADGYIIDKIEIESSNVSNMTSANNSWSTGELSPTLVWTPSDNVNSVVLTAGATLQFDKVTFFYQEGTSTAIIKSVGMTADGKGTAIFNLQGQRVQAGTKGLVIIDGKKMIVK